MEKKKKYKFNAFISYRHTDLDKFVAENLHRLIETYKMPEPVVKKYNITDNNVRRIFRDQEELPLSPSLEEPIIKALKESEFLIVICSPRIRESLWCRKEVENFIKFHGRNNVLCVLIEGEPNTSFPDEVLYHEEKVKNKAGKIVKKKVYCEPLAMDVKGANKKEVYKKMKQELIRIMAPLYKLDYDDIKRRHEERELKRKARIFKSIALASVIFAIYSFILFSRIYMQSNKLKYDQSINLTNESREMLNMDDRNNAILKSYQSLTKYNGIKMKKTAKGLYELTDALGVYYEKGPFYAVSQLDTVGDAKYMKLNNDKNHLLTYDDSGELVLWDLATEKRIKTVVNTIPKMDNNCFTFIGEKYFAYVNDNKEVVVMDLKGKEIKKITPDFSKESITSPFLDILHDVKDLIDDTLEEDDSQMTKEIDDLIDDYKICNIKSGSSGKYIAVNNNDNKMSVYETEEFKKISDYELPNGMKFIDNQLFDDKEENIIIVTKKKDDDNYNTINLVTYNINQKKVINTTNIKAHRVKSFMIKDNELIVLAQRDVKSSDYKGNYGYDAILMRLDYKNGKIHLNKEYKGSYFTDMNSTTNKDGVSTILVSGQGSAYLLDYKTGNIKGKFGMDMFDIAAQIFAYNNSSSSYLLITSSGASMIINGNESTYSTNTMFVDYYNFKVPNYENILNSKVGLVALTNGKNGKNAKRVIIYNSLENEDIKKIEYKTEYKSSDRVDKEEIIKEYKFKYKNLINKMFYSDDKKLLFVTYDNQTMEVYDTKKKKLLNTVDIPRRLPDRYICKTDDGEYLVGEYILNKNFEVIAYIPLLESYKDGKIIIGALDEYYEVKKYSEKEIIKKAEKYLKEKGKI